MITNLGVAEEDNGLGNIKPETESHGNMPSHVGLVPIVIESRESVIPLSKSKSKLGLYLGFFKFLPIVMRFAKNCWFESNHLKRLSYLKQVIWT